MLTPEINKKYNDWLSKAVGDADLVRELRAMDGDEEAIYEAFYRELEFGTGGLRGIIGAGTNRLNIFTVAVASQGLANYVINHYAEGERRIAIGYDSRIKSELFAKTVASVCAANGIDVWIYSELMPVPCLSFATRELKCSAGVMITASHNPAKYNGLKVYGADGCQITIDTADEVLAEISMLNIFDDVKRVNFHRGINLGRIKYIKQEIYDKYIENVLAQSLIDASIKKDVGIIYTPLNGAGLKPVLRALSTIGFNNVAAVPEQEKPDGNFPTCPKPNPEIKESLNLAIRLAEKKNAELVIATDPDCDRVGIAVKHEGEFKLLSGNEVGLLVLDYICNLRIEQGNMPKEPLLFKTIVSSNLADVIAKSYGVETINLLTGFKFIGEQIGYLEERNEEDRYIFGFEESYGYLAGTYVRDKDAVVASMLICEMFAYYKSKGISLIEKLEQIYMKHGYCLNSLKSYEFEGAAGFEKMKSIMKALRNDEIISGDICGVKISEKNDYLAGIKGLPKSDMIEYRLMDDSTVIVRPSGTEPKLKVYLSISSKNRAEAELREKEIYHFLKFKLG